MWFNDGSVFDKEFVEKGDKGISDFAFRFLVHITAWFALWVNFIIPAILLFSAIVFLTVYFAFCGSTWAWLFILAAIADGIYWWCFKKH